MNLPIQERKPITSSDIVKIRGRYLFTGEEGKNEQRFFVKGIGFPTPPPNQRAFNLDPKFKSNHVKSKISDNSDPEHQLDLSGWNAVLDQLAQETDINAVRIYELDCFYDYSAFFEHAAKLGIYVILPLTSRSGDGVLSRDAVPPKCYPKKLYQYGTTCVRNYWDHPNVLAGVIGNEVMNDLKAWQSAPCVKAFLDDMAAYSDWMGGQAANDSAASQRKSLPLMYATQHDSPSAELEADEAIKLTYDYLSCKIDADDDKNGNAKIADTFIFGVNIESWCSSYQSFEYEENGVAESSYHSLWRTLSGGNKTNTVKDAVTGATKTVAVDSVSPLAVSSPVVFSEMGCSRDLVNHDNDYQPKFVRDWKQIPLVLEDGAMSDLLSGFVAYGYDGGGSDNFRMMGGKEKWDGKHPLPSGEEYDNFRTELSVAVNQKHTGNGSGISKTKKKEIDVPLCRPVCQDTVSTLESYWGLKLHPLSRMPSYFSHNRWILRQFSASHESGGGSNHLPMILLLTGLLIALGISFVVGGLRGRKEATRAESALLNESSVSLHATNYDYGSV